MSNLKDRQDAHPLVEAFFKEVEGFSIKDASQASGLDRYTIIHWRTGRVRSPKLVEFDYLLQALGYQLTFRKIGSPSPINWNDPNDPVVKMFVGYDVEGYVEEYELRGDDGDYTPDANEKGLLIDAIYGVVADLHEKLRTVPALNPPLYRTQARGEEPMEVEGMNYNCPCIHPSQCDGSCAPSSTPDKQGGEE